MSVFVRTRKMVNYAKPEEIQMEARRDSDVQIDLQIWDSWNYDAVLSGSYASGSESDSESSNDENSDIENGSDELKNAEATKTPANPTVNASTTTVTYCSFKHRNKTIPFNRTGSRNCPSQSSGDTQSQRR
eukprot:Awhi_evm2s3163